MKLSERLRLIHVDDHTTQLFEGLWDLPHGVSYNSYIVVDDKIALIDTVGAEYAELYIQNIKEEIGDRSIDYLVINHMEPDHSSLISEVRKHWPEVTIVASPKAVPMIAGYHGITDNIHTVKEGETLSLGKSSLTFYMAPMVHWPETMVTWLDEEHTLFSGDAFGSFRATDGENIDGFAKMEDEMARYYACIVGKYGVPVQNALKKLAALPIERICSTHGAVWEKEIPEVVALYDRLSKYQPVGKQVCIVYGSMYGNTAKAAHALAAELETRGITYKIHNLNVENASFAYRDAFNCSHIIVGSPTYNTDIYPPVYNFMHGLISRQLKGRKFYAFGSFTWAGTSVRLLNEMATKLGFELLGEGTSFNQGYSEEKFNAKAIADLIEAE